MRPQAWGLWVMLAIMTVLPPPGIAEEDDYQVLWEILRDPHTMSEPRFPVPPRKPSPPQGHKPPRFSGSLREQTAFRLNAPQVMTQLRTVAYLAATGAYSQSLTYKASGRLWYDAVYDATRHFPPNVEDDQKFDAMLRDTYLDYSHDNWDLRLGKQQIVWGEGVGYFVADVVNARDLRELILQDFDLMRIPEWAADAEYTYKDFHMEGIWLPFPEMDKVAEPGAEFGVPTPVFPGIGVHVGPSETPNASLHNGAFGGRLALRVSGWDVAGYHLRTWDKSPVYRSSFDPLTGTLTLTETHARMDVEGFTAAKEIDNVVYKSEFTYSSPRHFESTSAAAPGGLEARNQIDYIVGADVVSGPWLHSYQFGQRILQGSAATLSQQRKVQSSLAFYVKKSWLLDHLSADITLVKVLETTDVLARPGIHYRFASHWRVGAGMDLLTGPEHGIFGIYRHHNRFTTELRYDF